MTNIRTALMLFALSSFAAVHAAAQDTSRTSTAFAKAKPANVKSVRAFLDANCMSCHGGERKEGDFTMDKLSFDNIAGRVAYASILERLRAGDMPPSVKDRPEPAESAGIVQWITSQFDTPIKEQGTNYAVKEKPVDGNRLPHAILFGGPRGPSVPPAPRLWRLSPTAYKNSFGRLNVRLQQPFGLIQDSGFRDFSALYAPDEGASSLLLTNAEQVVLAQLRPHALANILEKPEFAKETLWPKEARIATATAEERKHLENGDRVRQGNGVFAPLMHPKVAANRQELVKALDKQYQEIVSRPPSEKEVESLLELYKDVAKEGDYALAGRTILMAPLMTPEAILRFEIGLGAEVRPGVRMLSPRETSFAISLALSDHRELSLLSTAAKGKLTTREEVAVAVRNILNNNNPKQPKDSNSHILGFFREYFDYYRASEVFKDPLPDYLKRLGINYNSKQFFYDPKRYVADTDAFIQNILSQDRDVLKQLLTKPVSSRTQVLPPIAQTNAGKAPLEQIGILMQPSWLVAWSVGTDNDIVRRGRWVREKLLGGRVPDLPINVQAMVPEDPHRTLRDRQMVTRAAACWKCHYRMDDLGAPFEHVNHYGFLRATEPVVDLEATKQAKNKKAKIYRDAPLDTTGFILHSGDPKLDGPVKDAPEMLRRMADSDRVRQVFIRHAFRYYLGRNETPGDAPTLQEADRAYVESGGSFKALVVSLLSSESFLYRTVPTMTGNAR
jgi:mono/diheme cytochrome c family protein